MLSKNIFISGFGGLVMPKKNLTMISLGILTVLLASCGGGDSSPPANNQAPPGSNPSNSPGTPGTPSASKSAPFAKPFMAGKPQEPSTAVKPPEKTENVGTLGLIPSTNPDDRAKEVAMGRQDPFSVIPVQPIITITPNTQVVTAKPVPQIPNFPELPTFNVDKGTTNPAKPIPSIPTFPEIPIGLSPGVLPNPGLNPGNTPPLIGKPINTTNIIPKPPFKPSPSPSQRIVLPPTKFIPTFKPELPKLPEPLLAKGVEVMGVIQVGNVPQAIIKAPNESTSRYVKIGDRLSNGQVLVKRIEVNAGASPVVVLEQYGIEVDKRVGEKVGLLSPKPTAFLPETSKQNQV